MNESKIARTTIFVVMSLFAVIMLYPFYFMLKTAFKSNTQFISGANSFSLDSWQKLFTSLPVGRQLFNSLIVCTSSITLILIFSTYAGFGLAKLKFRAHLYYFGNSGGHACSIAFSDSSCLCKYL